MKINFAKTTNKYIKLMRVKHWVKNILILLPLFFSSKLLEFNLDFKCLIGLLSFCLSASAIYIINDIRDVDKDRLHSVKCNRPIASREVLITFACCIFIVLIILSLLLNYISTGLNSSSWLFLIAYMLLNLCYSFGLKNKPIIDIAILAIGFTLRVLYGSALINVQVSNWLYLTIIAASFYMGFGKRRNEIVKQGLETRHVLKHYNYKFLDKLMYVSLTLVIVFYSLWTVDPQTIARFSNDYFIWTVPLVIVICMKYSLIIESNSYGDPVDVLFGDKLLLFLVLLYIFLASIIVYINQIVKFIVSIY
jgi:decaprenyl-phosphate phosphoribosyltransferase